MTDNRTQSLARSSFSLVAVFPVFASIHFTAHATTLFVGDGGTFSLKTYNGNTLVNDSSNNGALGFPSGIAIGPDGNVYVADQSNSTVERFNGTTGAYQDQFISSLTGTPPLFSPTALAFGPNGNLYVGSWGAGGQSYISVYNGISGAFITELVAPGVGPLNGGLGDPNGIAFGTGGMYVTDPFNGIDLFDPITGAFLSQFVSVGSGPANLSIPAGLTFGPDGNLYVADLGNGVVDRFDTAGAFLGVFGDTSSLVQPLGVAFGPDGNLYVTDALGVERFNGSTGASMGAYIQASSGSVQNAQYLAFNETPEPSTLLLLAFGAALIAVRRFAKSGG